MILPQTYLLALILLILGVVCWASWVNLFKLSTWRYELFHVDVALGVMLAAVIYGFTIGNIGFDGLAVMDDLSHAGKRQWLFAMGGGALLNLGTMLIVGALSVAGMAVAWPIGVGLGLALGVFVPRWFAGGAHRGMVLAGVACSLAAMWFAGWSYASYLAEQYAAAPRDPKKRAPARPSALKALLLCTAGGMLMALSFPLFEKSRIGEIGMGPYSMGLLMAMGVLGCTVVAGIFLMNLPVEGEPLEIAEYFRGKIKNHILGWIAGLMWGTGTIVVFVVNAATSESHLALAHGFNYYQAVPLLTGLFGVVAWREFAGSRSKGKILLALLLVAISAALLAASAATTPLPPRL